MNNKQKKLLKLLDLKQQLKVISPEDFEPIEGLVSLVRCWVNDGFNVDLITAKSLQLIKEYESTLNKEYVDSFKVKRKINLLEEVTLFIAD